MEFFLFGYRFIIVAILFFVIFVYLILRWVKYKSKTRVIEDGMLDSELENRSGTFFSRVWEQIKNQF
ncbi:MAG: hypothetical protein EBR91_06080 [Flavobacteriia bacterium]|jgi:uncharacterized membrane protein|nr:hypothetical protein [Flavobacteriia bacterium]NBV68203.1 hypothetical protein [Flavobacteriia bacterium]NBV91718.1 hypothetical protein [Flavobacteriia bacterium]NBY39892.1 hypothetical protein [Flavobacteriia bacterium]